MILVDTSSWVELLRGTNSAGCERVQDALLSGDAVWCGMVLAELWMGARGAHEKRELAQLENEVEMLPMSADVWVKTFKLARLCRTKGITVPVTDVAIVACAAAHGIAVEHCDNHFDLLIPLCSKL